ncbi:MAG: hypothetical protein FWC64_09660 [Treponema sp.]|nr:hypothetical protein [Treponema sp.]
MEMKNRPKKVYKDIYMPESMVACIEDIAERDQRSLSKTVVILLESALNRNKQQIGNESGEWSGRDGAFMATLPQAVFTGGHQCVSGV